MNGDDRINYLIMRLGLKDAQLGQYEIENARLRQENEGLRIALKKLSPIPEKEMDNGGSGVVETADVPTSEESNPNEG